MNRSTVAAVALAALAPVVALTAPTAAAAPSTDTPTTQSQATRSRAAAPYRVVAKINKSEVVVGEDKVRITGRVKPKAAGQRVTLLQRREGRTRWVKSGSARIKRNGTFLLKDAPENAGVRYYRVLKPAANGVKEGLSKELELAVWAWNELTIRPAGANAGMVRGTSVQFGTEYYHDSVTTQMPGTAGYVEYTLGDKCRSLRATYALTDDSATGATGTVTVTADGVAKAAHPLTTGVIVEDHVIDVTDVFRLRFDAVATATPVGTAAIGSPEVLCLD